MEENKFKCPTCAKVFTQKKNLYAHSRNIHNVELHQSKVQNVVCKFCQKQFSTEKYLSEHIKKFHEIQPSTKETRIKCPYNTCMEKVSSFVTLRNHLSENHYINVELEELTFNNIAGMYDC